MRIQLHDIGKRFGRHWIFRGLSADIKSGDRIGITGINGSGKSSLLQIIAGISLVTEGKVEYSDGKAIRPEDLPSRLALISPYMDLPEQLTLSELFSFHSRFIDFKKGLGLKEFQEITLLQGQENNLVKQFSSGMKQRLKLGLGFLSEAEILLLDEPCSNLDSAGKDLYVRLLDDFGNERMIAIASNEETTELKDCNQRIDLMEYKKK